MNRVIAAALLVLAVPLALGVWWLRQEPAPAGAAETPADPALPAARERRVAAPAPVAVEARQGVAGAERSEPAPLDAPAAVPELVAEGSFAVRGLVVDPSGAPLAGVGVAYSALESGAPEPAAWTATDGSFVLELEQHGGHLVPSSDDVAAVRVSSVSETSAGLRHVLVAARAIDLGGFVTDEGGLPLAGAALSVDVPLSAGFPYPLDLMHSRSQRTESDAAGRFELARVPTFAGATLRAKHAGHEPASLALPAATTLDLTVALRAEMPAGVRVTGRVFHADGSPAPGARVLLEDEAVAADEGGRFELRLAPDDWVNPSSALIAVEPGLQPALAPEFGRRVQDGDPAPVELFLGGPALAISGRALDSDGEPLAGWTLDLADGVLLSPGNTASQYAEALAAGEDGDTETRADGTFEVGGLSERSYTLRLHDGQTLAQLRSEPIPAGTAGVELRLPADAVTPSLRGRVQAPDGTPLPEVRVTLSMIQLESQGARSWRGGASTVTAPDGTFELRDVPWRWLFLEAKGEAILPAERVLDDWDGARELVIVARRRCHFRVEGPWEQGDTDLWIQLIDPAGDSTPLFAFTGGGWSSSSTRRLAEGRSEVFSAPEGPYTLVVQRRGDEGEQELVRREIHLLPQDEVALITY